MSSLTHWRRVEELCHAALERDTRQRSAFLAVACDGDEELRREVESLLAHERQAPEFLGASTLKALAHGVMGGEPRGSVIGRRLGAYEVVALIGTGGMGEVYKARDTRLDRTVAIKVLPPQLAADSEFQQRFEREARTVARLTHPHICALYDVGHHDGADYLIMEYLEGETLAARLERGALSLDQALKTGIEIADALDNAHRAGITHRDLKPANVMLTKAGAKLLDFGLAKTGATAVSGASQSSLPATQLNLTTRGAILGTFHYMAPEQVEGQEADGRTDIFAFGAVLYEMLTGRRAFEGNTRALLISAILKDQIPSIASLHPPVSAALDRLVRKCLAKDPDDRWQTSRDLRDALKWIADGDPPIARQPEGLARRSRFPHGARVAWLGAALVSVVAIAARLSWSSPTAEIVSPPLVRWDVDIGQNMSLGSAAGANLIFSPDGTRVVFVSNDVDGTPHLFARGLDQASATQLAGTEGAFAPFFSPDGEWVAFFSAGKLKKIPMDGGEPTVLCDAPLGRGGSWSDDGSIVAALDIRGGLSRISSDGGRPTRLTELDRERGEITHRWPDVLPGGRAVLYTAHTLAVSFDEAHIEAVSLENGRQKHLLPHGTFARYLPSGHLLYVSSGILFAVPFDPVRVEVRGTAVPVLTDVTYASVNGSAQFDFANNGTFAYRSRAGKPAGQWTIQWLDQAGHMEPLVQKPGEYLGPRLSPDGKRIALMVADGPNANIWVYDWQRDTMTPLTVATGVNADPIWTPDGEYVVFQSAGGLFRTRADATGKPESLTTSKYLQTPRSFTPDGRRLAFDEFRPDSGWDIWTVPMDADASFRPGTPEPFLQTPFGEWFPAFSPDGRWMAYASNESGQYEVYVRAFKAGGSRRKISQGGGLTPVWARNGREMFYKTEDNRIMATTYTVTGDSFVPDTPHVWAEQRLGDFGSTVSFDLAPDGRRFAAVLAGEGTDPKDSRNEVTLLQNFFEEVRRRVATGAKRR